MFTDDSAPKLGTQVLSQFLLAIVPGERKLYVANTGDLSEPLNSPLPHGFIPAITDDGEAWVVVYRERSWSQAQTNTLDPLAAGSRFSKINGLTPKEVFSDHCGVFLGIRAFIDEPQLFLERENGRQLVLKATNSQ